MASMAATEQTTPSPVTKAARGFHYYDFGNLLSRNATINIAIGPRGDGKTYGAKKLAIRNAIKKGEQFILLRRYKTELMTRTSFFDDIADNIREEFPGYMFRVNGQSAEMKKAGSKQWEIIGHFVALSNSQQKKSVSYAKVTLIIFDEFIIDRGAVRYLPNEVRAFLDFYNTVDRWQDRTRAILISNSVSIMNPYFIDWDVRVEEFKEFITKGPIIDPVTGAQRYFLCVNLIEDHEFASQVRQTALGQFIENTEYADYSIGGVFKDAHLAFVRKKSPAARYYATIETETGIFALWIDYNSRLWYADEKRPKLENIWTIVPEKMEPGKVLMLKNDKTMQSLRTQFSHGRLFFSSPKARNAFIGVMKR